MALRFAMGVSQKGCCCGGVCGCNCIPKTLRLNCSLTAVELLLLGITPNFGKDQISYPLAFTYGPPPGGRYLVNQPNPESQIAFDATHLPEKGWFTPSFPFAPTTPMVNFWLYVTKCVVSIIPVMFTNVTVFPSLEALQEAGGTGYYDTALSENVALDGGLLTMAAFLLELEPMSSQLPRDCTQQFQLGEWSVTTVLDPPTPTRVTTDGFTLTGDVTQPGCVQVDSTGNAGTGSVIPIASLQ